MALFPRESAGCSESLPAKIYRHPLQINLNHDKNGRVDVVPFIDVWPK